VEQRRPSGWSDKRQYNAIVFCGTTLPQHYCSLSIFVSTYDTDLWQLRSHIKLWPSPMTTDVFRIISIPLHCLVFTSNPSSLSSILKDDHHIFLAR
jgi:hypothetical protein